MSSAAHPHPHLEGHPTLDQAAKPPAIGPSIGPPIGPPIGTVIGTAIEPGVAQYPDDYLLWDQGRLRVHPRYADHLLALGWSSVDAIMEAGAQLRLVRRRDHRECWSGRLGISDGGWGPQAMEAEVFLKKHREPLGIAGTPSGLHEADAVGWCQRAGVPTMEVLAAGSLRRADRIDSFFLSLGVVQGVEADVGFRQRFSGEAREGDCAGRAAYLDALASTARAFHGAGLYHRDFYWNHFFVRPLANGGFRAHLIDLQRVLRRPAWSWRWRVKDLAQFMCTTPALVTAVERRRWFARYWAGADATGVGPAGAGLRHVANARGLIYRWREGLSP